MKTIDEISSSLKKIQFLSISQYIEDVLSALQISDSTIKRSLENAKKQSFKKPIYIYKRAVFIHNENLISEADFDSIENVLTLTPRIVIFFNTTTVVCKDLVTDEIIEFRPNEIYKHVGFFNPLIFARADEKDLTTTLDFVELMASLFNQLSLDDRNKSCEGLSIDYALTLIYLSFSKSMVKDKEIEKYFHWTSTSHEDDYILQIESVFDALSIGGKKDLHLTKLPYFGVYTHTKNRIPHINRASFDLSAKILCYELIDIDSEVLGTLIYKLTQGDEGPNIYGRYISHANISKLLDPLFVNQYEDLISANKDNKDALQSIKKDLLDTVFFDPTNGPGCFLSSSITSISNLLVLINKLNKKKASREVNLRSFVGLVDNDLSFKFSHLTLWVSYLQYLHNNELFQATDLLDVYNSVNLKKGDQLLLNWSVVCPNNGKVFIIGSPEFKGAKKLSPLEKEKMQKVFGSKSLGDIDYSACWLYKSAMYIANSKSQCALVITNSICQGAQVSFIWKKIYATGCEISFAYRSFKWTGNANLSTGVTVIIVGLVNSADQQDTKYLFADHKIVKTNCIGPYLVNSTKTIVDRRSTPVSVQLPIMQKGNMPYDDQNLLLSREEMVKLTTDTPEASKFLKRIVGSDEFINNIERWCLWIGQEKLDEAIAIGEIKKRIDRVREYRLSKKDAGARRLADRPYQFREFRETNSQTLIVPSVSSEKRKYIPIGFISNDTIVSNLAFAIYDCEPWIFGLVSSQMHMVWIRTVCGNLETRLRYSSQLGYNTFPFPQITAERKNLITSLVADVISERENYCDRSLGDLYSIFPEKLRILHENLDKEIESCYQSEPFMSDMERIKHLFGLYENNIILNAKSN